MNLRANSREGLFIRRLSEECFDRMRSGFSQHNTNPEYRHSVFAGHFSRYNLIHRKPSQSNFVLDDEFVSYLKFKNFEFSELLNLDEKRKELEIELHHVLREEQQ